LSESTKATLKPWFCRSIELVIFASVFTSLVNWLRVGCARVILTVQLRWRLYPRLWTLWILKNLIGFNLGLVAAALFILQSAHCSRSKLLCFGKAVRLLLTEDAEALEQFDRRAALKPCKQINVGGQTWLD